MISDFTRQWDLLTPFIDLSFNVPVAPEGWVYYLRPEACSGKVAEIRFGNDNIPQNDGWLIHHRFTTGYQLQLSVALWEHHQQPACDDVLAEMTYRLSGALRSLLNTQDGRVVFSEGETGISRIVDQVRLTDYAITTDQTTTSLNFTLDSPFPYTLSFEDLIIIEDGVTTFINNDGNTDFWPVIKVFGPETLFVIDNNGIGSITYDSSLPGAQAIPGGSWASFDFFRNTCYMNDDQANLLPGIDPTVSDFFPMIPGENIINMTALFVHVLMQDAFD